LFSKYLQSENSNKSSDVKIETTSTTGIWKVSVLEEISMIYDLMFFTFNELFLMLSVLYKYKKFQQEISSP
jgi:hypothetical protein